MHKILTPGKGSYLQYFSNLSLTKYHKLLTWCRFYALNFSNFEAA